MAEFRISDLIEKDSELDSKLILIFFKILNIKNENHIFKDLKISYIYFIYKKLFKSLYIIISRINYFLYN